MAEPRKSEVLGGLPRTRPHRRSAKREVREVEPEGELTAKKTKAPATRASPARPRAEPQARRSKHESTGVKAPAPRQTDRRSAGTEVLGTAVQAAAELAEMGLTVGARAVRQMIQRLPRP